jgi:hypothetical protein
LISCFGAAFTSAAGFGVATGPACGISVGSVTALRGAAEAWGLFCPGGRLPVGLGVGPPADRFGCDSGWPGVVAGLGAIRFGGVPLGVLGDPPGTFALGDDLSTGEPGVVGFPTGSGGEPPSVPEVFTGGKAPCLSEGFAPSRFGGTGFFPAGAVGEALGVTFPFGEAALERFSLGGAPAVPEGFATSRLGGKSFFPAVAVLSEAFGVTFPFGECALEGFAAGEAPGVPEAFAPSRLGGMDLFPAAAAFGKAFGVTFAFGERTLGFNKLGGVFCPGAAAGEPGAPGNPVTCPLLPICGAKVVGFGKSFGGGFCSAMVFLSFSASWGLTPCHPFSTWGFAIRF